MYILPFHSFADVITNSSSELFMLMNERSLDEVRKIVAEFFEEEEQYVEITLIDTYEKAVSLLSGIREDFVVDAIKYIFNVSADLTFVTHNDIKEDDVKVGVGKNNSQYEIMSLLMRMERASYLNSVTIAHYLKSNQDMLQKRFKTCLVVKCWHDEDKDNEKIVEELNGINIGGY